ncbi:MAG TPA: copper chaperone PCu(A)C [Thiobacillus sp.]
MMKLEKWAAALLAGMLVQTSWAATVTVTDVWARATVPGQKVSGAYMQIQSDVDARLLSVSSPVVPQVEVHEMKMDGDVMRMRALKSVVLPKGQTVALEPGGVHLMLLNLKKPIAAGDIIPLTLVVESGGKKQTVEVKAEARDRDGGMQHHHHH